MRLVLKLIAAPLEVVTMLVRNDRVFEFQREGDGTFTVRTAPLNAVELAALARELILPDTPTQVIEPVRVDNADRLLYCPNHPNASHPPALVRTFDHLLDCPDVECGYRTDDSGHRYANT